MKLTQFTTSDEKQAFSAYLSENPPQKWHEPLFTREQAEVYLSTIPCQYEFFRSYKGYECPVLVIMEEDGKTIIEASPIPVEFKDRYEFLEGYHIPGEWVLAENDPEPESVDMIASGYDWTCPNCNEDNWESEITGSVTCDNCEHTYKAIG